MRAWALAATAALLLSSVAVAGCFRESGVAADQYLTDTLYRKMLIEVDHQQGKAPHSSATDLLRNRIQERCNKPDGVQVEATAFPESDSVWTISEIRALEKEKRDHRTSGTTAVFYVLYLGGRFEDGRVLGVAFGPTSVALFKDTIASSANPANPLLPLPFTAVDVERSVLVHEFGHVLGLVNHGVPMVRDHEDDEHPSHSKNKDSVMYWAVESSVLAQVFSGPPPTQFDADDIADLRAAGGK